MSNRVSVTFKENAVDVLTFAGRTRLGRVQRAEIGANLPNTPVQELGSNKLVGRIFDIPEVTATVSAMDVGPRTAFALAGVDWATVPSGSYIESQQMRYAALVQTFKSQDTDDVARTLVVPGAKLDRFSYNYSVGGDSTEEYSFMGTTSNWLKYDLDYVTGVVAGGAIAFSGARQLKNGRYVVCVYASGIGYVPNDSIVSSSATGVTFDTSSVPDGTPVTVAFHTDLTDEWDYTHEYAHVPPGYTPAPDQAIGVRGWGVELFLIASSGATVSGQERIYRAQTCTIQGQQQTTKIMELGNEEVVGYSDGIPDITGTLEIMQHDFRLVEIFSEDGLGGDDNYAPYELNGGGWGLLVKLWRRNANRVSGTPEKTLYIPNIEVTQQSNNSQVGQDARQTFNFASRSNRLYIFKGAKPDSFVEPA